MNAPTNNPMNPTPERTEKTPFRTEYNNDVGPDDEGFWEWWIVTNDAVSYRVDYKEQADELRDLLNSHSDALAQNEALRGALESIARAPAFDANSQSLVDLAQRTLKRIQT